MKLDHVAIWVKDLEKMKIFYQGYFNLLPNEHYVNSKKQFSSYFMKDCNGFRLELMHRPDIVDAISNIDSTLGLAHLAISVGSKELVHKMTEKLRNDGYSIHSEPRTTGDGYYESVILDPENNLIEITV